MMIRVRSANQRGHADYGWLRTWHSFSFGEYRDRQHMNFRSLRVINEDWVAPGQGFEMHSHHDMEIVTYVLEGALQHRDSLGSGEVLRAGDFQRMSAGKGIEHSEFNPSPDVPVHLYQVWLLPSQKGIPPGYEQRTLRLDERPNQWQLIAAPDPGNDAFTIHSDVRIYMARIAAQGEMDYQLAPSRAAWVQVLRGSVEVNGHPLMTSDGVAVEQEEQVCLRSQSSAEIMLFDLG